MKVSLFLYSVLSWLDPDKFKCRQRCVKKTNIMSITKASLHVIIVPFICWVFDDRSFRFLHLLVIKSQKEFAILGLQNSVGQVTTLCFIALVMCMIICRSVSSFCIHLTKKSSERHFGCGQVGEGVSWHIISSSTFQTAARQHRYSTTRWDTGIHSLFLTQINI